MNELALFAGAGGGLLASQLLGWRTVCAVELDWYCRCVLVARQNDRTFGHSFPIWDDICTFDGRPWRGRVDVITGGFPCQPFSTAAAGKNNTNDLWPEMLRVVADVAPEYVFAENVSKDAINKACDDLESLGYKTNAVSLSAADLGADHIRERYWLLAYTNDKSELLRGFNAKMAGVSKLSHGIWQGDARSARVPDGMAHRMERLKATGNGQVPVVAINALRILSQ